MGRALYGSAFSRLFNFPVVHYACGHATTLDELNLFEEFPFLCLKTSLRCTLESSNGFQFHQPCLKFFVVVCSVLICAITIFSYEKFWVLMARLA